MTNREYREAYRLDEHEKARIWQTIRTPFAHRRQRRTVVWLRWAGGLAAAACAVLVILDLGTNTGGSLMGRRNVAVDASVDPVAAPPVDDRKPAGTLSERRALTREAPEPRDARAEAGKAADLGIGDIGRGEEAAVRGGPTGALSVDLDEVVRSRVSALAGAPTPESGGTRNPNDRPYDLVYHRHYGVNPFVATEEDALSTFAVEVDDASWSIARRYLEDGHLPPPEALRLEEIVNHLDAGIAPHGDEDFSLHVDGLPSRFGAGYQLVRIGVRARDVAPGARRPAHLVFVIDVSGSMNREDRLGLVKRALRLLIAQLGEGDRVAIVAYGGEAAVVLPPTDAAHRDRILAAIDRLRAGGGTNAEDGLATAYDLARDLQQPGTITRLVLCSDGVANVGRTGAESILEAVRSHADEGITLTAVGVGMGNYNDVLLEQLADRGDGTYHYVHELDDAARVFRENLTGTLEAMGREVKVQVAFDPTFVTRWRLLGYENRDVADADFRDDAVDAGEIGAGHTAVALYEIKLTDAAIRDVGQGWSLPLGEVRLRWARPAHHRQAGEVVEIRRPIATSDLSAAWAEAPAHLRLAAVAAEFAEILRGSYWARDGSVADLMPISRDLAAELDDPVAAELHRMIQRAARLTRAEEED